MWILAFSARKYARIARITLVSSVVNIGLNLVLIPMMAGKGAAIAFIAASLIQAAMYFSLLKRSGMVLNINSLVVSYLIAGLCFLLPQVINDKVSSSLLIAIPILGYLLATLGLRQGKVTDIVFIKQMLSR
jgi:peptidoglycan biosynthesis protein MviN/MurJ (putative lipid II flippase)